MKKKGLKAATLATALALSISAIAMAAPPAEGQGGAGVVTDEEKAANGNTTISIFTTAGSTTNVNYEVPLYVTMAMTNGATEAQVPTNYTLINNTRDENDAKVPIAVTNMSFQKIADGGFETVQWGTALTATDTTKIALKIAGAEMPALSTKGTASVTLTGSDFFDGAGKPKAINDTLDMPITTQIANATDRTDAAAAASFRVKYTVSLVGAGGETLGDVYAGNDHTQAGLPDWHVDPTN